MPSVASFMMPAGKAVTACPEDKLRSVVDSLVNEKVGCVVVVDAGKAVGIITKQDVNRFFLSEIPLDTPVSQVMSTNLHPARPDMHRDDAAELLQREKIHHAVVVNEDGHFVGLFSSWDIARECALDAKAWPYNRDFMTKFGAKKSGDGE